MGNDVRPAATIVLVREGRSSDGPPEIFFVKRHHRSGFMANAYVFPGGRLDPSDCELSLQMRVTGKTGKWLDRMADIEEPSLVLGHVVAAIRETFEEAGILLARQDSGFVSLREAAKKRTFDAYRRALNHGEMSFESILEQEELHVSLDDICYFANWITPTVEKRRYNARFFVAIAPEEQTGSHDDIETTDSCWLSARGALDAYEKGGFGLAPPTWRILNELTVFDRAKDILEWAESMKHVPCIMPHFLKPEGTTVLTLPGDNEHPESLGSNEVNRVVLRDGRWWDK